MLIRRPRWGLSWQGFVIFSLVGILVIYAAIAGVHHFLAVTEVVESHILVIEGWMPPSAVAVAAKEMSTHKYDVALTTGGPFNRDRGQPGDSNNWAETGAYWLRKAGVERSKIHTVPATATDRDRTYHSAVALRDWLTQNAPNVHSVNVLTEGAHARRTRLLFEKALGPEFQVGIIAARNPEYDPSRWWRSSAGVREVVSETIAYLYARLLFHP